jgi:hypothetical protein
VEDLMFYHYPREELIADGKLPWREFSWQYGRADGDLEEDELHLRTRTCRPPDQFTHRHLRDDENHDRERKRTPSRGFLGRMSSYIDTRGKSREREQDRNQMSGWFYGESSMAALGGTEIERLMQMQGVCGMLLVWEITQ